jgi:ubiquinone/menaquinone biosynthesis C-methylase UbiE
MRLSKPEAELTFWKGEIRKHIKWFEGKLPVHYKTPSPQSHQKIHGATLAESSILTWHALHQQPKYLHDLELAPTAFAGMRIIDIGAGPFPSATCFTQSAVYCLDPLLPQYLDAGYPLHRYDRVCFLAAAAENIPVRDNTFDAVIAVNAIDHVDDIGRTSRELQRILKPGGLFRMHVHYHPVKKLEPIELDRPRFQALFDWCPNLRQLHTRTHNFSTELGSGEQFALWSNF